MRRLVVVAVWLAAIAAVTVAIGMRVRAHRLADPVTLLSAHVDEVPPEVARLATVVARDATSAVVELRADQRWVRTWAARNRFVAVDTPLAGLAAERWMLSDGRRPGAIVHLLLPLAGGPAQVTILDAPPQRR